MALLSAKNFTAPFANKVHLSTIAFVVVLFAAFRAMGGAFSVEPNTRGSLRDRRLNERVETGGFGRGALSGLSSAPVEQRSLFDVDEETDVVSSTVRSVPSASAQGSSEASRRAGNGSNSNGSDLDEIMRRLDGR